jgi:hypothetical protein
MTKQILFTLFIAAFTLSACGGNKTPDPALDPVLAMTQAFATVNAAFTQTALAIPTNTPAPTETPTLAAPTAPAEFVPTVILQLVVGTVANCRFGPDTAYAGPGGVRTGKLLEAIGRDAGGKWLLVRNPGGQEACWVSASLMSVNGDIMTLGVAPIKLIFTDLYLPPDNITATRSGDQIQVGWADVPLQPKDIWIESHYLLEVWTCSGGQLVFQPLATNNLSITIPDQPGCSEPSHGVIYTASRLGYSVPANIPWP